MSVERSEKLADEEEVVGDVVVTAVTGDEVAGEVTRFVDATPAAAAMAAVAATVAVAVVVGVNCLHISLSRDICCRYISCCVCGILAITMLSTSCCISGVANGIATAEGIVGVAADAPELTIGDCGRRATAAASIALGVNSSDSAAA